VKARPLIAMVNSGTGVGSKELALGAVAAALSGYLAVRFMLWIIKEKSLRGFAWYVWALGILIISDQVVFHRFFEKIRGFRPFTDSAPWYHRIYTMPANENDNGRGPDDRDEERVDTNVHPFLKVAFFSILVLATYLSSTSIFIVYFTDRKRAFPL